jgi:hypothetical protein
VLERTLTRRARTLEDERDVLAAIWHTTLAHAERERLLALGADVERAWHNPGATPATRKRIIRTLIEEIVVRVEDDALSLGGRRPHAAACTKEPCGSAPLGYGDGCRGARHHARPSVPGQGHRGDSQPRRQGDRTRQWLDARACAACAVIATSRPIAKARRETRTRRAVPPRAT